MNEKRIEKLIEDTGLTKTKVATMVGKSRETIYAWIEKDEDDKYELLKTVLKVNESDSFYKTKSDPLITELKAQLFDTSQEIDKLQKRVEEKQKEIDTLRKLLQEKKMQQNKQN